MMRFDFVQDYNRRDLCVVGTIVNTGIGFADSRPVAACSATLAQSMRGHFRVLEAEAFVGIWKFQAEPLVPSDARAGSARQVAQPDLESRGCRACDR